MSEGAVQLVGDVGVAVENVAGRVSVRALILPDQPVADGAPFKHRILQRAHLVEAVAGRAEHGSRDRLVICGRSNNGAAGDRTGFALEICQTSKSFRLWQGVIIDNVVEGAVDAVVDVQGLKVLSTAFASVHLGHDAGRGADEEPSWFGYEPETKQKLGPVL